jgi:hypothetical protein
MWKIVWAPNNACKWQVGFNSAFKELMYELKKIGKLFTSKFVGTGPSSYEKKKKNLPGRGLTKVEKHWFTESVQSRGCIFIQSVIKLF